jgi:TRAP-type C4-dicarboxylate transport system substrate-binding protein
MASFFLLAGAPQLFAEQVNLKAVSFVAKNHPLVAMAAEWVQRVNTELKGQVEINFAGGPEVIPTLQQPDAVKNGVVDIIFSTPVFMESMFPEGWAFFVSNYTPLEERKPGGFYDFMVKRFQRINMMYLGRWLYSPFYIWTKKPVSNWRELQGMKIRSTTHFDRFLKEMGAVPVNVMPADTYTALERGTVDGFGWPLLGARELGWTDKCKFIIDHPFHASNNAVILMNLGVWNKLSKDVQDRITAITTKWEPEMRAYFQKKDEEEWKEVEKIGVKRVHFSQANAKEYIDIIYRVDWEILQEKVPDLIPELKRVTGN